MFKPLEKEAARRFLVHGRPGAGKTHMIGTCVNEVDERLAIFDFKGGLSTIRHLVGRGKISTAKGIVSFDQFWHAIALIEDAIHKGHVHWVALDNLTDAMHVIMTDIRSVKSQKAGSERVIVPKGRPSIDDYGKITYQMERLLSKLAELPCNLVITAWSKFDRQTGFATARCETEHLADVAAGMCDYVFHLKAVEDTGSLEAVDPKTPRRSEHILYTKQSDEFLARDRSGILPPAMEPDFRQIIALLEEAGL